jgi:hypothetical protein
VYELGTKFDGERRQRVANGKNAAAQAGPRFQDQHMPPGGGQVASRCETRNARANHDG